MTPLQLPLEDNPSRLDDHGPLFVLGCPRSGTSYLTSCLGAFDGVEAFIGVLVPPRFLHLVGKWSQEGADTTGLMLCIRDIFWQQFWRRRYFRNERIGQLYHGNQSLREFLSKATLMDSIFCFKEPFMCFAALQFAGAFPKSKFIHIVRDGRDNANSMERTYPDALSNSVLADIELLREKNAEIGFWRSHGTFHIPWWLRNGDEDHFLAASNYGRYVWLWKEMTERAFALKDTLTADRYLEVRYEDFVKAPFEQAGRIGSFLGKSLNRRVKRKLKNAFTSSVQVGSRTKSQDHLQEASTIAGNLLGTLGYA